MEFVLENKTYQSVPDTDNNCVGCCFYHPDLTACNITSEKFDCMRNSIKWIEKEQSLKQEGYKLDNNKLQYSLIPPLALEALARNLTAGLSKYPKDNWKKVENAEERYLDALYRHLEAHRKGELYDSESSVENMPHMAAVAVNAMFLLEFMLGK